MLSCEYMPGRCCHPMIMAIFTLNGLALKAELSVIKLVVVLLNLAVKE
jgi:hypothetical protein